MIRNCVCSFFTLFFLYYSASAQIIQGKVTDEKTGKPISYVSIGVLGSNEATLTNENGDFEIKVKTFPSKLRFSHISYSLNELMLPLYQDQVHIKLKNATISLKEVLIEPKRGEKLLVAALKYAQANIGNFTYAHGFYRQLTTINKSPSEIYELFYDLKWNPKKIDGWIAKQSRFATSKVNTPFTINNQSFLTFIFSGMLLPDGSGKSIGLETIKDYHVFIDHIIEQSDQDIAVITCRLKKPTKKGMYVNSTYYIGTKNVKIYRLENNLFNLPNNFMDANKIKLNKPTTLTTISTFKANGNEVPTLESTATKLNVDFITDKQPYLIKVSSLLSVYGTDNELKKQPFVALNGKIKDKKVIQSIRYNAEFWKDNSIVKQTTTEDAFIKLMESKQAFGTMTNP